MAHQKPKYIEQYQRLIRWRDRLKPIAEGRESPISAEYYRDDLYAFFLNCYHLKDWIKYDPDVPHLKDLVEPYINESESLKICADLCNGLKHLSLDRGSRSKQEPSFDPRTYRRIEGGSTAPNAGVGILVVTKTGFHDAFRLAEQCLTDWVFFLIQNDEKNYVEYG